MSEITLQRDSNHVPIQGTFNATRFNETLSAERSSQFNFKPTWGISTLRYVATNTGTGAASGETGGEFRLQSGTANNGLATIQTNQRGQYQAGTMGQAGVGIRIPTLPTSTAFCEWGYTDFTNGFYFGVDGTGKYVADVTGSTVTKVYQSSWNIDKLDGTGPSGFTLDLSDGHITQIDFTWYGYGDIEYSYYITNPTTFKIEKIVCHRTRVTDTASIIDPNQPLTFRSGNGASTTTNVSLYIGGHQFSVISGLSVPQKRQAGQILTLYTTATDTNWQPIIAIRKKADLNGRTNSVLAFLDSFSVTADSDMQIRVTIGGTTSNGTWGTPTGWTATETALETKVTVLGTALAASTDGNPTDYSFVLALGTGQSKAGSASSSNRIALGATQEVILWVRRLVGSGAMIIKNANVTWEEEW